MRASDDRAHKTRKLEVKERLYSQVAVKDKGAK